MQNANCNNYLSSIAVSVVISLILALLFYNGLFGTRITYSLIFSLIIAITSFIILTIFGSSDNGLTRKNLCQNTVFVIVTILRKYFF